MGWWGNIGSPAQKRVTTYTVSPYAQSAMRGALERSVFNTWRRTKSQALYIIIPGVIVWNVWANARDYNEYLYTKAGSEELARVNV